MFTLWDTWVMVIYIPFFTSVSQLTVCRDVFLTSNVSCAYPEQCLRMGMEVAYLERATQYASCATQLASEAASIAFNALYHWAHLQIRYSPRTFVECAADWGVVMCNIHDCPIHVHVLNALLCSVGILVCVSEKMTPRTG
jgi:hypothetical protein